MSPLSELQGYAQANKVARSHLTPRYHELDKLERYAKGSQYSERPHWLDPRDDIPLLERGPHVVDPIVSEALNSYCDLLVDDAHLPSYTVPESTEQASPIVKLDDKQGEQLEQLITAAHKQARLGKAARKALRHALASRSVATLAGHKRGKLHLTTIRAKWAEPTFDSDGETVKKLEIRFPFLQRYRDDQGKWAVRAMIYRRVIDETADTTYKPSVAPDDGGEVERWAVKEKLEHGFGFCPVHWWAFDKEDDGAEDIDGRAFHQGVLNELDALHRSCSQHNRAGLYCGDPQLVETGVDENHNPGPIGRQARPAAVYGSEDPETTAAHKKWIAEGYIPERGGGHASPGARKKGPGVVWRFPNPQSRVEMLTLPAGALEAVSKDADNLRSIICRALAYVIPDEQPKNDSGITFTNMSGEALKTRNRRQLSRCKTYRSDLRDGWLLPVTSLLLRIIRAVVGKPGIYVPGDEAAVKLLDKFEVLVTLPDQSKGKLWMLPEIELTWPPFFEETAVDREARSKNARDDFQAGLITRKVAVTHIKPTYDIEDVDAHLKELEKERKEKDAGLHDAIDKLTKNNGQPPDPNAPPQPSVPPKQGGDAQSRGGAKGGAQGVGKTGNRGGKRNRPGAAGQRRP